MFQIVLKILANMLSFTAGVLPVFMLTLYKRLNLSQRYDFQSLLRLLPTSVVLLIVSVYKMVYMVVFNNADAPMVMVNVSLFYAIAFVFCVMMSVYFIIDRAISNFNARSKKIILNVAAAFSVVTTMIATYMLISQSQQNDIYYIDLAINILFPILTGVLSLWSMVSLFFYKNISKSHIIYCIIFSLSAPLIILDLLFANQLHILLTCIPYIAFVFTVFIEVLSDANTPKKVTHNSKNEFKEKYDLTDREMEVYQLAAQGLSNQEISEKLFVSVHTVKSHMQKVFAKLNITARYQLINFEDGDR